VLPDLAYQRRQSAQAEVLAHVSLSVAPDTITCLECGKEFIGLKRHLRRAHDQTREDYKAEFDLPTSLALVASNYSVLRSTLAKASGFGGVTRSSGRGRR
jgi:predicted transcriptional regulator